jgi:hypothetical protein
MPIAPKPNDLGTIPDFGRPANSGNLPSASQMIACNHEAEGGVPVFNNDTYAARSETVDIRGNRTFEEP